MSDRPVACWTVCRPREQAESVDDLRDSVTRPGGLLATLLGHGLVRQPEVVVTRSLAWLYSLPGGRRATVNSLRPERRVTRPRPA
jgi:hypothetical protein